VAKALKLNLLPILRRIPTVITHYKKEMWIDFRIQLQKIHVWALVTFGGKILLLLPFKLVGSIIKV
jgi:hypothetical protein